MSNEQDISLVREQLLPEFIDTCDQVGVSVETVLSKLKTPAIHKLRTEVWDRLRKSGWSPNEIAICSERTTSAVFCALKRKLKE